MINAQMSFRFDCLQTGGVQRFKCSPLFFILINKVTVAVAIKSFQSGDSRRPHSGLFTAHPKIKLFLESNLGDDNDNHYCVLHDDVDGNVCDDVEDADDWDEQGIMIVVVCAEQPVLKPPPPQLDDFIHSFAPMFKTGHRQFGLHVVSCPTRLSYIFQHPKNREM